MRIKSIPYKALPLAVAVWEALLKQHQQPAQSQPALAPSQPQSSPRVREPVKSLKRELSQLLEVSLTGPPPKKLRSPSFSSSTAPHSPPSKTPNSVLMQDGSEDGEAEPPSASLPGARTPNPRKRTSSQRSFASAESSQGAESAEELDLTDLQKQMLRVIQENGGSASYGVIAEEIQRLWTRMRKRDGSRYSTECRRAISSTLANSSSSTPLFERDPTKAEGWWRFGPRALQLDLDWNAIKAELEDPTPKPAKERNTEVEGLNQEEHPEPPPKKRRSNLERLIEEAIDQDQILNGERRKARAPRESSQTPPPSEDIAGASPIPGRTFLSRRKASKSPSIMESKLSSSPELWSPPSQTDQDSELTDLQKLIIEAINSNNGSATMDFITNYVSKHWTNLKRRDATDCKKAVKASLTTSAIFERDSRREANWRLARLRSSPEESPEKEVSRERSQSPLSPHANRLTDMQEMLMRIILSHGGVCTFEEIFDEVTQPKNRKPIRQLGNDTKRALLASLSHNPPGNFKKTREGHWTVAAKAIPVAKQLIEENPELSLDKILQESM